MKGVIIWDSREQKNDHILKALDEKGIRHERRKLNYGDYSFEFNGKSYENEIVLERKGSLSELIGNFTKGKNRFRNEFERAKGCKVILMVEASLSDLEAGNYRSRMSPRDLKSFLKTWCNKFQLELRFIEKDKACDFILDCFREYFVKIREG
jgi:ERCC4-type nuclease